MMVPFARSKRMRQPIALARQPPPFPLQRLFAIWLHAIFYTTRCSHDRLSKANQLHMHLTYDC
jgi:hypothetical protein